MIKYIGRKYTLGGALSLLIRLYLYNQVNCFKLKLR